MSQDHAQAHKGLMDSFALAEWTARNLPIRFFGDEILHNPCKSIHKNEFGSEELNEIISLLVNTLANYRQHTGMGRGIAANQIGYSKRIIVVWLEDEPMVLINPAFTSSSGLGSYWESCISSGTLLLGEVHRSWQASFTYQDSDGAPHNISANEKETRILLHEIDHLDGFICSDRYIPGTATFITGGKQEIFSHTLRQLDV